MKYYRFIIILIIFFAALLPGCYNDTVQDFSSLTIQFPIMFYSNHNDRVVPDTSIDTVDFYDYKEYNENKDKISDALVYQFNYRFDSLVYGNNIVFDSTQHSISFDAIRYYILFGKLKDTSGYVDIKDKMNYEIDTASPKLLLGEYLNVNVKDYYRTPWHILQADDVIGSAISQQVKNRPVFYIFSEYTQATIDGQRQSSYPFPFIRGRYDLVVRLKIKF